MSSNATIRLRVESHQALKEIARVTGESLQSALDRAIEDLRRKTYLEGLNADYAALRQDPKAWEEFQKELGDFDSTNTDGLEDV
jgi:hypothetical protein